MKGKLAIAYLKYVNNGFYDLVNRFLGWTRMIFAWGNKSTTDGLLNVFEFDAMAY